MDSFLKQSKRPKIASIEATIEHIINHNKSVSRFGDGEFRLIFGLPQAFQHEDKLLSIRLNEILQTEEKNHIICLPSCFGSLNKYTRDAKRFYMVYMAQNRKRIYKIINFNKLYFNTDLTRPYMSFKDKKNSKRIFSLLQKIWNGKDITIIEGEKSRLGIGNDLFSNAKSIHRILCPAENAFQKYNEILQEAKQINKKNIILIALGPTATVLAYDLHKEGFQAIDIGHIDIEYEWFLRGVDSKVKIENKYVNEAEGGRLVGDIEDENYSKQIKSIIN